MVATTTFRKSSTDVPVETRSAGPPLGLPDWGYPSLAAMAHEVRDLADMVIQRMFAAGLALDDMIGLVDEAGFAKRLGLVVDELDASIRELRGASLGLTHVDQRLRNKRSEELGGEDG